MIDYMIHLFDRFVPHLLNHNIVTRNGKIVWKHGQTGPSTYVENHF